MRRAQLPARVAIFGFARSGRALARTLCDRGVAVSVGDAKPRSSFEPVEIAELERRGVSFWFDGPSEEFLGGANWLALSPGVPLDAPAVGAARARGLPVLGELEIAWRIVEEESSAGSRWIAVTGTNGKSTTTSWIAEILRRAGRPVALAGNIGVPLSAFLGEPAPRDYVCEVSSFQLESIEKFRPRVAVLTNITPDHLDRYSGFEEYARAKKRIFQNQGEEDFAVVNAEDAESPPIATRSRKVPFSSRALPAGGVGVEGGWLVSDVGSKRRSVLARQEVALEGAHNLENALAALAAAECLQTPEDAIRKGLKEFRGLPHRTELVLEAGGVRWINDSKGTNVDATRKSLKGHRAGSVILILGGRDKHGDFSALRDEVARAARLVLTIGEAAETIERAMSGVVPLERAETLDRAVARAAFLSRPGDTVLLSPACASFDQYPNFEERGLHFTALARAAARGGAEAHGS